MVNENIVSVLLKGGKEFARSHKLLLVILIFGFLFRLTGIFWGMPVFDSFSRVYQSSEPKIIEGAYDFPGHIWTNLDLRYPTALHYTLGIISWPLKKILERLDYDPYYVVFMIGRFLSLLAGTATILAIFFLSRQVYDKHHAVLASFLLAFSMFHVTNSAWVTTDVTTSFLLTLFLLFTMKTLQTDSVNWSMLAGVSLGLLVGTKYTGALAVIPLLILVASHEMSKHQANLMRVVFHFFKNKHLWIIGLISLVAFLLTTPGIVLYPDAFISSIQFERSRLARKDLPLSELLTYQKQFVSLWQTLGFPLAVTSCLGLAYAFIRRNVFEVSIATLVISFFLYFGATLSPRYIILIMPCLAILSSLVLRSLISSPSRFWKVTGYACTVIVCFYSFGYSALGIVSRYSDTRTQAAKYVAEKIPPGASIGIAYASSNFGWRTHAWRFPKIDFNTYQYEDFLNSPDFIIFSSSNFNLISETLHQGILNEDFLLPKRYWKKWYQSSPPSPEIFKRFHTVREKKNGGYSLLRKFAPQHLYAPILLLPPTIEIYERL